VDKRAPVVIQASLGIITVLTVYARHVGFPVVLFWPALWSFIGVTMFAVNSPAIRHRTIVLIVLVVVLVLIRIAALPHLFQLGGDAVFEAQTGSYIAESGYWNPELGSGYAENYYGYNPVLHFTVAVTSLTTGIDSYILVKYVFPLLYNTLIMLLVFYLIKRIVKQGSEHTAYIATIVFIGSIGFVFIGITRRSTASIFVILSILSLLREEGAQKKMLWNGLCVVFSTLIVLSNRSIAFYFFFFLCGAYVFSIITRYVPGVRELDPFPKIAQKLLFFTLVLAAWQVKYYQIFLVEDLTYIRQIKNLVFGPEGIRALLEVSGGSGARDIYRRYETYLVYASQVLFLLTGGIGFLFFILHSVKRSKIVGEWVWKKSFLLYFGLFGLSLYLFSALLMRTPMDTAVSISLWFFVIPICIFVARVLNAYIRKGLISYTVQICGVLFLISTSLFMGNYTPRITNRAPAEDIVAEYDERSMSRGLYQAGYWLGSRTERGVKSIRVLGDWDVYSIFSGFFGIDVNPYPLWLNALYLGSREDIHHMIEKENFEFGSYAHTHNYAGLDYFVINKTIAVHPSLTFGDAVGLGAVRVLDSVPQLDKVYSNDDVILYKIERGMTGE
jgi:hypothetical protein